jgi:hypothetical protein
MLDARAAEHDDALYSFDVFGDVGGGVTVMSGVAGVPAPDTDPDSIPKGVLPPAPAPVAAAAGIGGGGAAAAAVPASGAGSGAKGAAAAAAKKSVRGKGVGFAEEASGGKDDDGGDGDGDGAGGGGAKKKKAVKPPRPTWSLVPQERGHLLACGGKQGDAALLRVYHVPFSLPEEELKEWRHLANATVPGAIVSLSFSQDSRCVSRVCVG